MDSVLAVLVGIGLAASCGFRVFVPLLVSSLAANAGYLELADGFQWLGDWPALAAFGVASVVEVGTYYVPWLDNLLDTIASPAGMIAGAVLFAASVTELDPFLHWTLAVIAGGGAAGIVQGGTVVTRVASTASSGGLANFAVSTFELAAGLLFSALAIVVPVVTIVLLIIVIGCMYFVGRTVLRTFFARRVT